MNEQEKPAETVSPAAAPAPAPNGATAPAPERAGKRKKRHPLQFLWRLLLTLVVLALLFCVITDLLYHAGYVDPAGKVGQAVVKYETLLMGESGKALDKWDAFWQDKGGPAVSRAVGWIVRLFGGHKYDAA